MDINSLPSAFLHNVVDQCMSLLSSAMANFLPVGEDELQGKIRLVLQNSADNTATYATVLLYPYNEPLKAQKFWHDTLANASLALIDLMRQNGNYMTETFFGLADTMGFGEDKMPTYASYLTRYLTELSTQYAFGAQVRILILTHETEDGNQALVNVQMQEAGGKWVGMRINGKPANYWLSQLAGEVRKLIDKRKGV